MRHLNKQTKFNIGKTHICSNSNEESAVKIIPKGNWMDRSRVPRASVLRLSVTQLAKSMCGVLRMERLSNWQQPYNRILNQQ